jgi:hypothetical protein
VLSIVPLDQEPVLGTDARRQLKEPVEEAPAADRQPGRRPEVEGDVQQELARKGMAMKARNAGSERSLWRRCNRLPSG